MVSEITGKLYIIATPIGNLGDITYRAVEVLRNVNLVVSEDTRRTKKLLNHLGISKTMLSYYKDREKQRAEEVIAQLSAGYEIALVSDAGTPAVSDPGSILVARCYEEGITVVPIPGVSSLTAALSVAGFTRTPFTFLGFLPAKKGQRHKLLTDYVHRKETLVFFESANRLVDTVRDCQTILGDREAFLARELTKIHEELIKGTLGSIDLVLRGRDRIKGECVLVIAGAEKQDIASTDLKELLCWQRDNTNLSLKEAVGQVAADLSISRSKVYKMALEVYKGKNG